MSEQEKPPLLTSWKEIAAFFGRDVRTVQRWEHEGLPVHRRPGQGRSGVFADPDELQAWLRGRAPTTEDLHEPAPAAAPRLRVSARFVLAAAAVLAIVVSLSWMAASQTGRHDTGPMPLAQSPEAIGLPRWGNVDGNSRPDLIFSLPSAVLLFLDAGANPCRSDARECADVRITAASECALHSSQISDVNGDGIDDLAVSCLLSEPASHIATGPAYLIWGRTSWPRSVKLPEDAAVTIEVTARHDDRMGTCLSPQGPPPDLNGDGIADLLLGAVETPYLDRGSAGTLFVFFGRRAWPPSVNVRHADISLHGSRMGEGLGYPCATGDFTGDGRQDLAVGAGEDRLWNLLGGAGRTYLIENPGSWPAVVDLAAHRSMRIDGRHRRLARSQLRLADLDGDTRSELIVSHPARLGEPDYRGLIGIWRGGALRVDVTSIDHADLLIEGSAGGNLGASIDAADFDNDGRAEIITAETGRGSLLAFPTFGLSQRRMTLSAATLLASFTPLGFDDGIEGVVAIHGDQIAYASRVRDGSWKIALHQPFAPMPIDFRPYSADDVLVKPGVAVVAVPRGATLAEPLRDTLRVNGTRPFAITEEDFNRDGTADLMLYLQTSELKFAGDRPTVIVTGRDRAGRYLRGTSAVRVVVAAAER